MDQEKTDTDRQRVQLHINQLVSKYLHNNYLAIEHKPGDLVLLQWPRENGLEKVENIA